MIDWAKSGMGVFNCKCKLQEGKKDSVRNALCYRVYIWFGFMMFDNISVISFRSVLLVEESGVPGENHQPAGSH